MVVSQYINALYIYNIGINEERRVGERKIKLKIMLLRILPFKVCVSERERERQRKVDIIQGTQREARVQFFH